MKNSSLILLLFFMGFSLNAQKKINTDSLEALLNPQVRDTTQIILLNQLASEYAKVNSPKPVAVVSLKKPR